jgi:hypothetical protein
VAGMSSAYAIRLFELLMQWGSTGQREVDVAWLKQTLMVEQGYERLDNFKKRVIDVALVQINAHSDLTVSYIQRKTGRNVTHFLFTFAPKADLAARTAAPETLAPAAGSLFQRLRSHGIGAQLARRWLAADPAQTEARLDYVEARARQGLIQGSTAGYLRRLWEAGAEVGPSAFAAAEIARVQAATAAQRQAEAARLAEMAAAQAAQERAQAVRRTLTPAARQAFAAQYRTGAGAARSASWDAVVGDFTDPLERLPFEAWLQRQCVEAG